MSLTRLGILNPLSTLDLEHSQYIPWCFKYLLFFIPKDSQKCNDGSHWFSDFRCQKAARRWHQIWNAGCTVEFGDNFADIEVNICIATD